MIRAGFIFYFLMVLSNISNAQCPTSNFNLPATGCTQEQLYPINSSTGASAYFWDFCSGDFELTPTVESIGTSSFLNRGRSFRIAETNDGNWIGFSIDQSTNQLVRFEFGNSLLNTPTITNLGNPSSALSGAYDFVMYEELQEWYILVINSTTNELIRFSFGASLINSTPTATNLGDFSQLNTPNNLTIVQDQGNVFVFISNGGNNSISRVEFGNSILNTPIVSSFNVVGANNPRGIDIAKDCDSWIGLVTSYSNNKVFTLDFQNDLSLAPVTGEILFYTSYSFPAALSIIFEGGNYYGLIQSALGNLYKLSFGTSIADFSGTGESLGNFGLNSNFATEWVGDSSNWHGFSIELSNPSTPGAGNLIRYTFPTSCSAIPATSKVENPVVAYSLGATNQISLEAYSGSGNVNASTQSITISSSQAPQLTAQITGNCLSSPISFSGQQVSGSIANWNWDFGDGIGTSTLQNDTYTYATAGNYQVKLTVTDANSCTNLLIDTVQVYEEPIPNFSYPVGNLCKNNPVLFTNTTTGETGAAVTWTWDFNGEGASSEKEPSFTFLTSGSKTITLTSSIPGCANVTQQTINIEESPTTAFSFNNTCNGAATTFTDATTGNNLTTWNWNFGDGTFSAIQNPTHNYAAAGNYVVTLTVGNNLGCTTTKVDTVYSHSIPVVNFANDLPCSTTAIQFTDQSLVANANMVAWEWDFGDGNASTEQHPSHVYNQTGNFTVSLKAYSQFGCFSTNQSVVSVAQGPVVDFEWDKACEGEATTFTDLTNSFGIAITNWAWIIEGNLLNTQNPSYTFNASGTYTVQLTVQLVNNCTQTIRQDVLVEIPPIVQFRYNEGCGSTSTTFYDTTNPLNDAVIAREWRADGTVFSTDSVATTSLAPGNYNITLSVITNAGCEETTTTSVSLIGSPFANFETPTTFGAAPLKIDFTNLSTGGNTYLWSFGDANNTTSTEQHPTFIFNKIGQYAVTLRTSSTPTCYDETTQLIEVVNPISSASIIAVTPLAGNDKINFVVTIENTGTNSIDSTSNLVFRADYGTEVIEPINALIYAGKTINYAASYAIASNSNTKSICVDIIDPIKIKLDKSCVNITVAVNISEPYPNPTTGVFKVDVNLESGALIKIRVVNRSGQLVLTKLYEGEIGLNQLIIDGQVLPQGIYMIEVNAGGKTEQLKASVVR